MCRCGVSCDYIYKSLMRAENDGKSRGFKLAVDMLFSEDESVYTDKRSENVDADQKQLQV